MLIHCLISPPLTQVRSRLRETVTRLLRDIPNIRIGIIAHGDYCDQDGSYVVKRLDITSDTDKLVDFVDNVPRSGGEGSFAVRITVFLV